MQVALTFIISYVIYILLTWVPDIQELIAGFLVAAAIAFVFSKVIAFTPKKFLSIKRYLYFFYYIPVFLYYMVKANIDVAYRVLHPKMPINPGIVKVKTNLKSDAAITALANSITLTPGTLSVDVTDDGYMYIHWIDVKTKETEKATELIVKKFEKILKEVFE